MLVFFLLCSGCFVLVAPLYWLIKVVNVAFLWQLLTVVVQLRQHNIPKVGQYSPYFRNIVEAMNRSSNTHASHPTTRVLALLELLQTHGQISGAALSAKLGVDGRTLRRYIVMLEKMGIPITAEMGRHGGYSLVAGFKLPPMMFTDDEALALSVGLLAARHLGVGAGAGLAHAAPAVASAQAKLERIMPANLKARVRSIDESVKLDLRHSSQPNVPADNAVLVLLSAAAQVRNRVRIHYRDPQQRETERDFDCYGLIYRSGCWYAAGMCHLRRGLRTFRLDRITQAAELTTQFKRPDGFDALTHLVSGIATLPREHLIEVLLRTDLKSARAQLMPTIGLFVQRDDGVLIRCQADDLNWFAGELARLPFDFEIIAPTALRNALKKCGTRFLRLAGRKMTARTMR